MCHMSDEIKIPEDLIKKAGALYFAKPNYSDYQAIARWMREECAKAADSYAVLTGGSEDLNSVRDEIVARIRKVGAVEEQECPDCGKVNCQVNH